MANDIAKSEEEKMPEEVPVYESDQPEEQIKQEMETGEREADVYSEEGREELDEEMSPAEQGFMEGAEGLGEDANCKLCEAVLGEDIEKDKIIAREINGKRELFCSVEHADQYEKEHKRR